MLQIHCVSSLLITVQQFLNIFAFPLQWDILVGQKHSLTLGHSFVFSLSAWLQTTRRCQSSFHTQEQHFPLIQLIFRLFAQAGSTTMFSSALPSKTQRQQKAVGRLCTHFVRDDFHSQQRIAGALRRNRTSAAWQHIIIMCESGGLLELSKEGCKEQWLFFASITWVIQRRCCFSRVWWALCSALLLACQTSFDGDTFRGKVKKFSVVFAVCVCQEKNGNLLGKSGNNWIILCWGTVKPILKIIDVHNWFTVPVPAGLIRLLHT